MAEKREFFFSLDHSYHSSINIGDEKILEVVARGDMEVPTKRGNLKVKNIYYAHDLKHSLINIRKMLEKDYNLLFEYKRCKIFDKNRRLIIVVNMTKNKFLPLRFVEKGENSLVWELKIKASFGT